MQVGTPEVGDLECYAKLRDDDHPLGVALAKALLRVNPGGDDLPALCAAVVGAGEGLAGDGARSPKSSSSAQRMVARNTSITGSGSSIVLC